jgi:predicted N-acetyltransferase YhbS
MIAYFIEPVIDMREFIDVLERSGLAARRPVDKPDVIRAMIGNANLIVCACDEAGRLIGVARSVTDFSYCCYLSDLAVDRALQRQGIGSELIRRTHEAAGGQDDVTLLLLSAPDAMSYYPRAGLDPLPNCFGIMRRSHLGRRGA